MASLPNKLVSLVLRPPILSTNTYRYLRGGTTFTIKTTKPKKKESEIQSKRRFREVSKGNLGAGGMLNVWHERHGKLDPDMDPDYIDEFGTAVTDVNAEFNEQYRAAKTKFDSKSLFNIKRKYFKEPRLPNMVPYIEKQDMKILHENDPENWNIDKLSESFPVTPEIAKKILRSRFTAYTVEQVRHHDEIVKRNWKLLKEGKLDMPDELRSHLLKFIDRVSLQTKDHVIKKYLPPKPDFENHLRNKEFSSIIDKYETHKNPEYANKNKIQVDEDDKIILEKPQATMSMIDEKTRSKLGAKHVTLDALRNQIKSNTQPNTELSKLIVKMEKKYLPPSKTEIQPVEENDYLVADEVLNKDYEISLPKMNDNYPLRIKIPRDKWKPDQIYQVKDRFYDDGGSFLFRVPGLFS